VRVLTGLCRGQRRAQVAHAQRMLACISLYRRQAACYGVCYRSAIVLRFTTVGSAERPAQVATDARIDVLEPMAIDACMDRVVVRNHNVVVGGGV
jgi:hypothetical protein